MSIEAIVETLCGNAAAQRGKRVKGSYSAAVVSRNELIIATVLVQQNGTARLIHEKCGAFQLDGDGQVDAQAFFLQVRNFLSRRGISQLVIRMAPPASRYGGTITAAIVRTALQLIEELWVQELSTFTISRWVDREEPDTPEWSHRDKYKAAAQQRAIEAALYFARHARKEAA